MPISTTYFTPEETLVLIREELHKITATIREENEKLRASISSNKQEADNEDIIFNSVESANFLNVALPTFYEYTSKNLVPHFKKFKKIYCRKSDLEKWLESGRRKTTLEIQQEVNLIVKKGKK